MKEALKTYSHLTRARRIPSDYDLVTSQLLYYVDRGFEVDTPLSEWYLRYQKESPLRCDDWETFSDPRQTTYTKYVNLQRDKEAHVDGILRSLESSKYDAALNKSWVEILDSVLPQLRYAFHALQMAAAYVGQMAPSGRLTVVFAMQAADEVRCIERIAYRMALLRRTHAHFGERARETWQCHAAWQAIRRLMEELLVAFDWGEAFVALNLCIKPVLDDFFMLEFARLARSQGDPLLGEIFFSLNEDARWHRSVSEHLVRVALSAHADNARVLRHWVERWLPQAASALSEHVRILGDEAPAAATWVADETETWLQSLGVLAR